LAQSPPRPNQDAAPVETFDAAWRIIDDSYFDPTFHGVDWAAVKAELRPKAEAARNNRELRPIIEEMLHRLGDSHMALIPRNLAQTIQAAGTSAKGHDKAVAAAEGTLSSGGPPKNPNVDEASDSAPHDGDLGMEVRIRGREVLVTRVDTNGPASTGGVKPGWLVRSVGGDSVEQLLEPVWADSNARRAEFMAWTLMAGELTGRTGSTVEVEFENHAGEAAHIKLQRRHVPGEPTKLGYLPILYPRLESQTFKLPGGGKVGLIRFNYWMVPIIRELDEKIDSFRSADGIIIDLRGNLGGLGGMILGVSGHFLKDRVSLGTLKMRGNELMFYTNPRFVSPSGQRVEPFAGSLAILIDGISLSAAEIFAGGMQAIGRARVFGEASGGQALPAIWDRLPNGDVLYHAFGDFVTTGGARLEGRGVIPDQDVPVTRQELLAGHDAPLEAALRWITEQKATSPLARPGVPLRDKQLE
jgi:carboxyl-terminal processing protease